MNYELVNNLKEIADHLSTFIEKNNSKYLKRKKKSFSHDDER